MPYVEPVPVEKAGPELAGLYEKVRDVCIHSELLPNTGENPRTGRRAVENAGSDHARGALSW